MTSKLLEHVLEEIKERQLRPLPKWQFVALNLLLWAIFIATIFVGGLALGVVFDQLAMTDWEIAHRVGHGPVGAVAFTLPYVWFLLMIITVLLARVVFARTKKGYRLHHLSVLAIVLGGSLLCGAVCWQTGCGYQLEGIARRNIPPYENFREQFEQNWMEPEEGVLAGEVESVSDGSLRLETVNDEIWVVDTSALPQEIFRDFGEGTSVFVRGEKTGDKQFTASEVRLWRTRMMRGMRPPRGVILPMPPMEILDGEKIEIKFEGEL